MNPFWLTDVLLTKLIVENVTRIKEYQLNLLCGDYVVQNIRVCNMAGLITLQFDHKNQSVIRIVEK